MFNVKVSREPSGYVRGIPVLNRRVDFVQANALGYQLVGIQLHAHGVFLRAEDLHSRDTVDHGDALREQGTAMPAKDIATVTGQKAGNNRQLLLKMAKSGEIEKVKYGVYALPATPGNTDHNGNTSPWWKE